MSVKLPKMTGLRAKLGALAVAAATAVGVGIAVNPSAAAEPNFGQQWKRPGCEWSEHYWIQECWFRSDAMGRDIKVQIRAANSNKAVYLLDGLRARDDKNAWSFEHNARAAEVFQNDDVNLVMPVGGQSSFYTDWDAPSNFNGQTYTYKWETFLTRELPAQLKERFGISPSRNAIVGLSMGATAAMNLGGKHRNQFKHITSLSGYLNPTAPGMNTMIRLAMLDAGMYNVDAMWGPPFGPRWGDNDPFVNAERYRGMPMYISASSGLPGQYTQPVSLQDHYNTFNGVVLEGLSVASTQTMRLRLDSIGIPATYSFPPTGIHAWPYWGDELRNARGHILWALEHA